MTTDDLEAGRAKARALLDLVFADLGDLTRELRHTHCITCALIIIAAMLQASAFALAASAVLGWLALRAWGRRLYQTVRRHA
jgi:hypothetical protein